MELPSGLEAEMSKETLHPGEGTGGSVGTGLEGQSQGNQGKRASYEKKMSL